VDGVLVAVGAELFQFQPGGGIAAIFGGGIARHTRRSLVNVRATFGAFQIDNQANTFLTCHISRSTG